MYNVFVLPVIHFGPSLLLAQISTFLFSPNGKYLLYVAEKKKAKSASFLDKKKGMLKFISLIEVVLSIRS